jgi:hypothetical protein
MCSLALRCAFGLMSLFMLVTMAASPSASLALSSSAATPGGTVPLNLSLTSASGSQPAGIEWTFTYSPSAIVVISAAPGAAATAAGKSLACSGSSGTYMCFLTGISSSGLNANIIGNGVVAVLTVTVSAGTTINVTNALSTSAGGNAIPTTATGGTITTTAPASLTSLSCNPGSLSSGASTTCTVGLNQTASFNTMVTLSDNSALLAVPASVNVPAGASSANFVAVAGTLTANQSAVITATLNGSLQTTTLILVAQAVVSSLACNPTTVSAGSAATCTVTLSEAAAGGGSTVGISSTNGALAVPASVNVPAGSFVATFSVTATTEPPDGGITETASITATLNGVSQSAPFTLILCPCSLWPSTAQPITPASSNTQSVEVGMQFTSSISGYVTGVRFFKGSTNLGTHVGNLWTASGTHLAQVTFINETASGWQVAYFHSPIAISANTTYVISYHAPQGHNAADNGSFTTPLSNLPLEALADGQNGPNGVYAYGSSGFPDTGASATNYWVDVIFNTSPNIGTAIPVSVFAPTAVPTTPAVASSQPAALGMTFMSSVPGYVTGVRFYKSPENLGAHVGYLWSGTGTMLEGTGFANESASGWQQANFPSPVAIDANTPYVISYWSPDGHYADDTGYFATSGVTNQMLYVPPDGQYGPNGAYATSKVFPANSSNSSNYWVDVVFTTAIQ